jgi:hypothetical protein
VGAQPPAVKRETPRATCYEDNVKRYTLRGEPRPASGAQFRIPYADELNPQQLEAVTTL